VSEASGVAQATFSGLLYDPTRQSILLRDGLGGWELPWVHCAWSNPDRRDLSVATARLSEIIGIPVLAIRYVVDDQRDDPSANRSVVPAVYVLESREPIGDGQGRGSWIHRDALADLPLVPPDHRALIVSCVEELAERVSPPFRQPWSEPGWYGRAVGWIQDQLGAQDYRLLAEPVQVQSGSISCVLKCPTDRGDVFFKATGYFSTYVDEPLVQATLARWYPELVAAPIAIDSFRRWMLNADFGQSVWSQGNSLEHRLEVLAQYSALQLDSAARIDDLSAIGCIDRRLDRLAEQIEPLVADPLTVAHLDAPSRDRLSRLRPALRETCQRLADYRVPDSLVHGDLHGGNVAVRDGRFIIYDWTDACVAHPFLDPFLVCLDTPAEGQAQLRDRYLAPWTKYEPIERLREAWDLAGKLYGLHQAVSYQAMANHVEEAVLGELIAGLPWALHVVLEAMAPDGGT
jgi:hypothetical protein